MKPIPCFLLIFSILAVPLAAEKPRPVRAIWDYADELDLTGNQVRSLRSIVAGLQERLRTGTPRAEALDREVDALVAGGGSLLTIRRKLREAGEIRLELRMADIEAQRRILDVLSEEQLARWRTLQKSPRKAP